MTRKVCEFCNGEGFKVTHFVIEDQDKIFEAINNAIEKGTCPLCEGKGYLNVIKSKSKD